MKKQYSNQQIWENTNKMMEAFPLNSNLTLPAKIAYVIEYNKNILLDKYQLIEQMRQNVAKKYGNYSKEQNSYILPPEKIEMAQNELNQVLEITQLIDIFTISLKDIENYNFTLQQMNALLFMIEEE